MRAQIIRLPIWNEKNVFLSCFTLRPNHSINADYAMIGLALVVEKFSYSSQTFMRIRRKEITMGNKICKGVFVGVQNVFQLQLKAREEILDGREIAFERLSFLAFLLAICMRVVISYYWVLISIPTYGMVCSLYEQQLLRIVCTFYDMVKDFFAQYKK